MQTDIHLGFNTQSPLACFSIIFSREGVTGVRSNCYSLFFFTYCSVRGGGGRDSVAFVFHMLIILWL